MPALGARAHREGDPLPVGVDGGVPDISGAVVKMRREVALRGDLKIVELGKEEVGPGDVGVELEGVRWRQGPAHKDHGGGADLARTAQPDLAFGAGPVLDRLGTRVLGPFEERRVAAAMHDPAGVERQGFPQQPGL